MVFKIHYVNSYDIANCFKPSVISWWLNMTCLSYFICKTKSQSYIILWERISKDYFEFTKATYTTWNKLLYINYCYCGFCLQEHDHSCTVHARLYTSGEHAQTIAEFSLDLVSPVEYLFRKFSANEFGKPSHLCIRVDSIEWRCECQLNIIQFQGHL